MGGNFFFKKTILRSLKTNSQTALEPEHLCCPLTGKLFHDPVQVIHGNTYERKSIEIWLQQFKEDPIDGEKLFVTELFPDDNMFYLCQQFLKDKEKHNFTRVRHRRKPITTTKR